MASARISRLLMVGEDGRLAGILSRRDVLGCFLRPDDEIRDETLEQVILRELSMDPGRFVIRVEARLAWTGTTPRCTTRCAAAACCPPGPRAGGEDHDRHHRTAARRSRLARARRHF